MYLYDLSITNLGKETADYRVTIEAYDKDGDFLGEHDAFPERLGPDKTNRQPEQLIVPNAVSNGTIADIADLKVTDVERGPAAHCSSRPRPTSLARVRRRLHLARLRPARGEGDAVVTPAWHDPSHESDTRTDPEDADRMRLPWIRAVPRAG